VNTNSFLIAGQISAQELKEAMKALGFEPDENEVEEMIAQVDTGKCS